MPIRYVTKRLNKEGPEGTVISEKRKQNLIDAFEGQGIVFHWHEQRIKKYGYGDKPGFTIPGVIKFGKNSFRCEVSTWLPGGGSATFHIMSYVNNIIVRQPFSYHSVNLALRAIILKLVKLGLI